MLEIKNVTKRYGEDYALKDVSFTIGKGLTFITGASGSGKTTLLKIMNGMERDFNGDVFYFDKSIKALSDAEQSFLYNKVFGFVWQDFHLLEDLTVLENILLPCYLHDKIELKRANTYLKNMRLSNYAGMKVKKLSGGQKQRVAIIRELMKNPQMILCDEPTSALDEVSSKTVMNILREISKTIAVVIVTHDTSMIEVNDPIIELDKGELLAASTPVKVDNTKLPKPNVGALSSEHVKSITLTNIKRHISRYLICICALLVSTILLLTTFSGSINSSGQESFDKLLASYGEGILDMSIVSSFSNASGVDGNNQDKPNGDVSQNINGLYKKYANDPRVDFMAFLQAFDDVKVSMEGKEYPIEKSGSVPVIKKMLIGNMASGNEKGVVVPKSFIEKTGAKKEDLIGKKIVFEGSVYNWESGQPDIKKVKIEVKITGVADNTAVYEGEGTTHEYTVDDSFFFNRIAMNEIAKQADFQNEKMNFMMRAKTPNDLISLKDELNKTGIVPLGQFELIEDMVRLSGQTHEQSSTANAILGALAVLIVVVISIITNLLRKREYAIYKVNGYSKKNFLKMSLMDTVVQTGLTMIVLLISSPLLNIITTQVLGISILSTKMLSIALLLTLTPALITFSISSFISTRIHILSTLKSGDK